MSCCDKVPSVLALVTIRDWITPKFGTHTDFYYPPRPLCTGHCPHVSPSFRVHIFSAWHRPSVAVLARNIWRASPMASAVARAYNEGMGAEPPAGCRNRAPGQGARGKAPWSWSTLAFGRSMEVANLAIFLKFWNANKLDICVIFAKNHGWQRKWGGLEQNWAPGQCLKSPLPPMTICISSGHSLTAAIVDGPKRRGRALSWS